MGSVTLTSMDRPAASGPTPAGKSAGSDDTRWLGTRCAVWSNHHVESAVSTRPLPGTGFGKITSNTETRSEATMSMCCASTA
jgi:hypothetical protein